MHKNVFFYSVFSFLVFTTLGQSLAQTLRPPAYPLITHDPYFSVWSMTDKLTDSPTRHWTGKPQSLEGMIRVDGKAYQFLGAVPTTYASILPTAELQPYTAQYTTTKPETGWEKPDFDAGRWLSGAGPFGDTPEARTRWATQESKDIYIRREFTFDGKADRKNLQLVLNHDDDVEVYLNGVQILSKPGYVSEYIHLPLSEAGQQALRTGKNVLAVHCVSPRGGSFIDVGIVQPIKSAVINTAEQTNVTVSATQTNYVFTAGPVKLAVNFLSPLLMDELDVVARPVTYVTFSAQSDDGKPHAVQIYFSEAGTMATNTIGQKVMAKAGQTAGISYEMIGTEEQPILQKKGDNIRIDWGYAYLAVPQNTDSRITSGITTTLKQSFLESGQLASSTKGVAGEVAQNVAVATVLNMGNVTKPVEKYLMLAYDDLYSVQYFNQNLRAWWCRDGKTTMPMLLQTAAKDYSRLRQKSTAFDAKLHADAQKAGGKEYADLCVLAYRQAIAAHKIVAGPKGNQKTEPVFFFSKENFSNGSIGTVDVTYPSAPLFLLYNNELAKGLLRFIFDYSESGRWKKDFPAHDVGTYPLANGQTYGEDMPVEEAGNMIILTAAAAHVDGNATFAREHWPTLTKWVSFLKRDGFDPTNQLCTDDFAGHLARNANLSAKAIIGIACYGKLAGMMGDQKTADEHLTLAREMAKKWMEMDTDGDHYALTFDKPAGSWSQKYNIVWDKMLDLNVFPAEVARKEIAFYLKQQKPYGLPLDSRKTYTKSDWIIWTATLAESPDDFQAFIKPVWKFANETPSRVPLNDWHETTNAKQVGFQARSVVGGYYIKMLEQWLLAKKKK